jgi:hypothetical protein
LHTSLPVIEAIARVGEVKLRKKGRYVNHINLIHYKRMSHIASINVPNQVGARAEL